MTRRRPSARATGESLPVAAAGGVGSYIAALIVAGALVYANSISGPFTFDDRVSIVENASIRRLWPLTDALSPPAGGAPVAGRPLVNLSFALNYALGGASVRGYHFANLALHLACGVVLFGLIRRTLLTFAERHFDPGAATAVAFAASLVWLVHPVTTEAVNYVSQRTELMMALFLLVTLYAAARIGRVWATLSVAACALGMACKETMAVAPLLVIVYDRSFRYASFGAAMRERWRLYGGLAATWLILAALIWEGPRWESAGFSTGISAWTYLLNQAPMIVEYLRKALWPRALVFDYGEPVPLTISDVAVDGTLIVLLLLVTLLGFRRYPRVAFLGLAFFLILAPTSSFIPIATEVGADRRMYLPLAALATAAALTGWTAWNWGAVRLGRSDRFASAGMAITLAIVSLALSSSTLQRNTEYRSEMTLYQTTLERWPHARAHRNLATVLKRAGYRDEVVAHMQESLVGHPEARYALGFELFEQGRFDEAIEELRRYAREYPNSAETAAAYRLIGEALVARGKPAEAVDAFRLALSRDQNDVGAQAGLADAFFGQGRFDLAAPMYRKVVEVRPGLAKGWSNLGVSLANLGQADVATVALRRAVDLDANDAIARRNLAVVLTGQGNAAAALEHADAAVRLAPADSVSHFLLAVALEGTGRMDDAVTHLRRAIELDPMNEDARAELSRLERLRRSR